jgi:hypothetical protein
MSSFTLSIMLPPYDMILTRKIRWELEFYFFNLASYFGLDVVYNYDMEVPNYSFVSLFV